MKVVTIYRDITLKTQIYRHLNRPILPFYFPALIYKFASTLGYLMIHCPKRKLSFEKTTTQFNPEKPI